MMYGPPPMTTATVYDNEPDADPWIAFTPHPTEKLDEAITVWDVHHETAVPLAVVDPRAVGVQLVTSPRIPVVVVC